MNDPAFSWSGASDGNCSSVAGYYVYWGIDPANTIGTFQVATTFSPGAFMIGTYYLRVMTRDNFGINETSWETLFVFQHESTAPANPPSGILEALAQGITVASSIAGGAIVATTISVMKLRKKEPFKRRKQSKRPDLE